MTKFRGALSCSAALGALLAAGGALAGDFTVPSGDTVNLTQELTDPGDIGLIESGGTIDVSLGEAGVKMNSIGQNVTNQGDIFTSGGAFAGILSTAAAANAQITNSGNISASGINVYGIFSSGANAQIANSGSISASSGNGVYASGADGRIDNSGGISGTGGAGIYVYDSATNIQITNSGGIWGTYTGIHAQGNDARITNSGSISGNVGVWVYGFADNVRIANSGRISGNEYGVLVDANTTDALIINSGTIMTPDGQGIVSLAATPTVTNSGRIISSLNTYAIFFAQQNATLNLLAGSVIQGGIGFSNAEVSATLNIGPGLNMVMSFADVPGTINTFGAPMVVQGPLVAVVDPTGFSAQDEMLTDLTRAIANAVDGRINAARFGYAPSATPLLSYAEADGPADAQTTAFGYPAGTAGAASPGHGFWAAGIGAYRNQDADGPDVGFDTGLGGLLVGLDGELANGMKLGAFLGASASRFETDANSQEIDADSYFGGVYGSYTAQTYFLDMSLTGGVTQQSSDRSVANNMVEGGIEHAKADYDGVFVSPSATIGTTYSMGEAALIPTFRARYAGLFLDGYEERGSVADMTVDDRDVNVFDFRAQLAYALAARPLNGGVLHTALRFGADATFADQDDVQAVLLGTGLNFSVSGDDTLRGFAGLDLSWRAAGGADFFLGGEAGYDSGDAFTLDVLGGLRIPL